MTDPTWYTDDAADPDAARWAAHVEACVRWLASPAPRMSDDGGYIMQTALTAIALHRHRTGGNGVLQCRFDLLDDAAEAIVIVGWTKDEVVDSAHTLMQTQEIERLRAEIAALQACRG